MCSSKEGGTTGIMSTSLPIPYRFFGKEPSVEKNLYLKNSSFKPFSKSLPNQIMRLSLSLSILGPRPLNISPLSHQYVSAESQLVFTGRWG